MTWSHWVLLSLHALACTGLLVASLTWLHQKRHPGRAHRFLFPYICAASVMSMAPWLWFGIEMIVAHYSGSIFFISNHSALETVGLAMSVVIASLPVLGLIPAIGRHAPLMALVAFVSLVQLAVTIFARSS